jgi:sporulation protein YlmC with PRC-barrel domain
MATLPTRTISCVAAILGSILDPVLGASPPAGAQQTEVSPSSPPGAPPSARPVPPRPSKPPAVKPSEAPIGPEQELVGLDVFSSDGTRVGQVRSVTTGAGGDVVALLIRTGGFLGFGGRTVAIPQGRFTRTGQTIRLDLDTDQVSGLPEVKE